MKDEDGADSGGKRRAPEEGDTCPIVSFRASSPWPAPNLTWLFQCFEEFEGDKAAIVYCESSCGGPVHNICIAQWHATKPEATCIYCRAPWPKAGAGNGEASRDGQYLNLASAVGISNRRDTTSYYHG